ncbi:MAG: MerR family transcriptional regulator [Panacagrimonas sp.]
MKMQELEQRTGVRREMIHFYFRNGLLPEPARPKPNVADYGDEHVRSILAVRRLQSEQRLSIAEIKTALNGHGATMPGDAKTFQHLDELVAARLGADQTLVALTSLAERNPKADNDAKTLHKVGAIELVTRKGQRFLSRVDAQIVGTWGDMRAAGFTEELGFDAGLASIYVDRAKDLAKAEIAAYLERVTHFPKEKKAEWAQPGLTLMGNIFSLLRMKAAIGEFRKTGL